MQKNSFIKKNSYKLTIVAMSSKAGAKKRGKIPGKDNFETLIV